jgi:hypothetical protein
MSHPLEDRCESSTCLICNPTVEVYVSTYRTERVIINLENFKKVLRDASPSWEYYEGHDYYVQRNLVEALDYMLKKLGKDTEEGQRMYDEKFKKKSN